MSAGVDHECNVPLGRRYAREAMGSKLKQCAYCGIADVKQKTRDHVVPRALWKDGVAPTNPVIVPACRKCQKYWDAEATYFRNLTVMSADPADHPSILRIATGAIVRRVRESWPDYRDLTRNAVFGWKQSPTGLLTEPGVRIEIDMNRFLRTPEKIIRGLFFLRNGRPVPEDYDVRIYHGNRFWEESGFSNLLEAMEPWAGLGDDVFQLRATYDSSDRSFTIWLMLFFKSSAFLGWTCPKNYGRHPSPLA